MIKGVNKHIIEINYTQDEFIEKAILFVNPTKSTAKSTVLLSKANNYMDDIIKDSKNIVINDALKPKKRLFFTLLKFTLNVILGALITCIIVNFMV